MSSEDLLFELNDHVAIITLNRPAQRNAISQAMSRKLTEYMQRVRRDDDIRVAIITGAGGTFCAGADLKERAASGGQGRLFPWGDEFQKGWANVGVDGAKALVSGGSYPKDVSPYNIYDMAGNVMEWTSSWYLPYPGNAYQFKKFGKEFKVLRGNGFQKGGHYFLEAYRYTFYRTEAKPDEYFENVGFRCVLPVISPK